MFKYASNLLLLTCNIHLWLSHLGDHKLRHNFQDYASPLCTCVQDIETTTSFFLHQLNHHCARKTLFCKINQVSGNISRMSDSTITKILLFDGNKLDSETNKLLLMSTIDFISLTLSWRRHISYRNQSFDLLRKSMDWSLYDLASVMKGLTERLSFLLIE